MTRGGLVVRVFSVVAVIVGAQFMYNQWYISSNVAARACFADGGAVRYVQRREGENGLHGYKFVEYTFECYNGEVRSERVIKQPV